MKVLIISTPQNTNPSLAKHLGRTRIIFENFRNASRSQQISAEYFYPSQGVGVSCVKKYTRRCFGVDSREEGTNLSAFTDDGRHLVLHDG